MKQYVDQTIELNENVELACELEVGIYPGRPGSGLEPPDDAYITITRVFTGSLIGKNWEKSYDELVLSGWLDFLLNTKKMRQDAEDLFDMDEVARLAFEKERFDY